MTQKERIEQLEREVADLRTIIEMLRAQTTPFRPYNPPPTPQPWPNHPLVSKPVYYNMADARA